MAGAFGSSLGAGLLAALGIGLGFAVSLLTLLAVGDAGEVFLFLAFFAFGVLAFFGAALIGAIIGLAAGTRADAAGTAAGAGLLGGLLGHLIVLLCIFTAVAAYSAVSSDGSGSTGADGDFFEEDEAGSFDWSFFGQALVFLLPAGVTGAVVAAASFRPSPSPFPAPIPPAARLPEAEAWPAGSLAPAQAQQEVPPAAPAEVPAPLPAESPATVSDVGVGDVGGTGAIPEPVAAPLRKVLCPSCRTPQHVPFQPGTIATCISCGFSAALK